MRANTDLEHALVEWQRRASKAEREAHRILAGHERSVSRVILLEDLLQKLEVLPVDIQDYFREATKCLEQGLLRAAVVLSWAGFFYVLLERNYVKHKAKIRAARPKWSFSDLAELRASYPESQILDALRAAKLISRAEIRVYQGQLSVRNQCAHPTLFRPSLNSTLGFVDDMLHQTIQCLSK
jgi:hypothetical protein